MFDPIVKINVRDKDTGRVIGKLSLPHSIAKRDEIFLSIGASYASITGFARCNTVRLQVAVWRPTGERAVVSEGKPASFWRQFQQFNEVQYER